MLSLLQKRGSRAVAAPLLFVALLLAADAGFAQVPTCEALTLYGNAANSGLCKTLSPATQNLWVCGMTTANPDVHTTFNAATALHVTVVYSPAPREDAPRYERPRYAEPSPRQEQAPRPQPSPRYEQSSPRPEPRYEPAPRAERVSVERPAARETRSSSQNSDQGDER